MTAKLWQFGVRLFKACAENDLIGLANELTYQLLLAFFPFMIFLMSLIGFFNFNSADFMSRMYGVMPDMVYDLIKLFVNEVVDVKSAGVLSVSLIITLYNASSGFNAVISGINRAYGLKDTRNFVTLRIVSVFLVLIFALSIILSIAFLVFGNVLYGFVTQIDHSVSNPRHDFLYGFLGYFITMFILLTAIILIYRFATCKKIPIHNLIPGALTTLIVWIVSSKLFNIYINNFAKFSKVYGSVASVIILIYWINILSLILLVGGAVNALLDGDPTTP